MSNFKRYYQDNCIAFITIVTYNRQPILIDHIDLLRTSLKLDNFEYKIIAGIVMPDHIHLLIQTQKADDFPQIITAFKVSFSKKLPFNTNQTVKQKIRREKGIWQRRYYDHIIRNDEDYYKHLDYIHFNSIKHLNISPKDWKFSSFKNFMQLGVYEENWCNFGDKNNILEMNIE